jgi:hypothetical protein
MIRGGRTARWLALLLIASAQVHGQQLPAEAQTIDALVPGGWAIEQRHAADFNGDGRRDALLLLRRPGGDTVPPRTLLVALARRSGGFVLAESNARLIPVDDTGRLEDPMADGEIVMRPAGFDVKIGMVPTTGSYQAATMWYRFRFGGGCFRLVAYDRLETHRATLDTNDLHVSLMTGHVTRTIGNAERDAAPEIVREQLRANPRRCLAHIGNGWTFDPLTAR